MAVTYIASGQYRLDNSKRYFILSDHDTICEDVYYRNVRDGARVRWYRDYKFDDISPRGVVGSYYFPKQIVPTNLKFDKNLVVDTPELYFEFPEEVRRETMADQPAILNLTYHFNSSTTLAQDMSASIDVGDMFATVFNVLGNVVSRGVYSRLVTMAISGVLKGALRNKWVFSLGIKQGFKYPPDEVYDNVGMTVYAVLRSQYNFDQYRPWVEAPTEFEPQLIVPLEYSPEEAAEYLWSSVNVPPTSFKMDLTANAFSYSSLSPSCDEGDPEFPDWFFA